MAKQNQRIFPVIKPLAEVQAEAVAYKQQGIATGDPVAAAYVGPEYFAALYSDALKALKGNADIISLAEAAELMALTPAAYIRKADRGQAVLLEIEGHAFVPRWTFHTHAQGARVKPFHMAVAKEFATNNANRSSFDFSPYLKFMAQKIEMGGPAPQQQLAEIYRAAGVFRGDARIILSVPMAEVMDRALKNPRFMAQFIHQLGQALSYSEPSTPRMGGISEAFLEKYVSHDIPARTRWKLEHKPA